MSVLQACYALKTTPSVSDKLQIGLLIVTFLGVVLSLLLWLSTLRSLREIHRQNENMARSIKTDVGSKIIESHQNIFLTILNNPDLRREITKDMPSDKKYIRQMIGTILINHCSAVHLYGMQKALDTNDWIGIQNDIADLFKWPIIKERWPEIISYYSKDFQKFINDIVSGERQTNIESIK